MHSVRRSFRDAAILLVAFVVLGAMEILLHVWIARDPSGFWGTIYRLAASNRREIVRHLIDMGVPCMVLGFVAGAAISDTASIVRWLVYSFVVAVAVIALWPVYAVCIPERPLWWWPTTRSAELGYLAHALPTAWFISFGSAGGALSAWPALWAPPYP